MELVRALELESVDGDGRIASEIGMVVGRETRWWPFIVWRRRSRFKFKGTGSILGLGLLSFFISPQQAINSASTYALTR